MTTNHKIFVSWLPTIGVVIAITLAVLVVPETAHAEKLYQVLEGTSGPSATIKSVWKAILDLINYAGIGLLIFIAFANILRLNINTYGIKKFLPTLILAIVAANFSYLICRLMIDLANIVMDALISGPSGAGSAIGTKQIGIARTFKSPLVQETMDAMVDKSSGAFNSSAFWKLLILVIAEFIGAILMFILAFLFFIRNYIIYFLVALSPLAFISTVLPQTKSLFNQWWSNFLKWAFLPVVSIFWLWLGSKFISTINDYTGFLAIAFAMACYYMAIMSPFKLGGGIMSTWKGLGQKAWGATGGAAWKATGGAAVNAGKEYVGHKYGYYKAEAKEWTKQKVPGIKHISEKLEEGGIQKDLETRKLTKIEQVRKEKAFMRWLGKQDEDALRRDPVLASRVKTYAGELKKDEYGDNYRNEMKLSTHADNLRYVRDRNTGVMRAASVYDFSKGDQLFKRDINGIFDNIDMNDPKYDAVSEFKVHVASGSEILRRSKSGSLDRADGSMGTSAPSEIRTQYLLDDVSDFRTMGTSAVGDVIDTEEAVQEIAENVGDRQISGHLANLAGQTGIDFEVATKRANFNTAEVSPEALESTRNLFEQIRKSRDDMIAKEMEEAGKQIDGEMAGTKRAFDRYKEGGTAELKMMKGSVLNGQNALETNNFNVAKEHAVKAGFTPVGSNEEETRSSVEKFLHGAAYGVNQVETDINRKEISTNSDWKNYSEQLRDQKLGVAKTVAETNVASQIVMKDISESVPANLTVSSLSDPEAVKALETISKRIVEGNEGLTSAIEHLGNQDKTKVKSDIGKDIQSTLKEGLSNVKIQGSGADAGEQAMALKAALRDPNTNKALSKSISLGMEKTIKKIPKPTPPTNVTNVTNTTLKPPSLPPSPPNPINRPDSDIGKPN